MDGWRSLLPYDTKNLKIFYAWVCTGHFCKEYENSVVKELAVHFGRGEKSPGIEIADGLIYLWLIMMDMSLHGV